MTGAFAPGTIVLEIPARTDFVSFVRVVVAAAAELEPDLPNERIEDLKLAVSEATTNAINAHSRGGSDERIRVECRLVDDELEREIDFPQSEQPPPLTTLQLWARWRVPGNLLALHAHQRRIRELRHRQASNPSGRTPTGRSR